MLINLRNALMTGKRLPYDAEVEFLESDGSQFIKVPGKISSTSRITVTFKYTGATFSRFAPFGGGDGNMAREASLISGASSTGNWTYRCGNVQNFNVVNLANSQVHTVTWYKDGAILDGVDYPSLTTSSDFTPTRDYFGLFANLRNGDNSPLFTMRGYIMSAQVYDNGVLVRDYIPVRKGAVGYLYDRVSGKLFGNAGTGDFVLGPDVVPVEYIESHGTEYIITDYVPNDNSVAELDFQSVGGFPSLMGVYSASSRFNLGISSGNNNWFGGIGAGNTGTTTALADSSRHKLILDAPQKTLTVSAVGSYPCGSGSVGDNTAKFNLFARSFNGDGKNLYPARLYGVKFSEDASFVRSFRPVRVGTDATSWEGAMMDVLTRRIYRNAGTGAFTYGNDLKYPIPAE